MRHDKLTIIIFCIALYGLSAADVLSPDKIFSDTENRVLMQKHGLNAEDVLSGRFGRDYETYTADQFVGRDWWIALKTYAQRLMLMREIKGVYIADDGYMIERHAGVFSTSRAKHNAETLAAFVERYHANFPLGHISVMIIPNAVTVLRDKLPTFAPDDEAEDYINALADTLPPDVWVDALSVLKAHAGEYIYYRTDHHWTTLGAFYVWQTWAEMHGVSRPELSSYDIRTVAEDFHGTIHSRLGVSASPDSIEIFCPEYEELYNYEALKTRDKYAVFLGGNTGFVKLPASRRNGRKILVIKDSYANCFVPFLMSEFEEVNVLDLRYSRSRLSRLIRDNKYTDIMILYNASGFAEDTTIDRLLR